MSSPSAAIVEIPPEMEALAHLALHMRGMADVIEGRLRTVLRATGVTSEQPIANIPQMPVAATVGSAFNAFRSVHDIVNAVNSTDAASSNPSQFAAIPTPASRPPPAFTNTTRHSTGYAITPQALATSLVSVPPAKRPGAWYVVTTGRFPGIYRNSLQSGYETVGVSGGRQKKEASMQAAYDAYFDAYYAGTVCRVPRGMIDDYPHNDNSDNEDDDESDEDAGTDDGHQNEVISISSDSDVEVMSEGV